MIFIKKTFIFAQKIFFDFIVYITFAKKCKKYKTIFTGKKKYFFLKKIEKNEKKIIYKK